MNTAHNSMLFNENLPARWTEKRALLEAEIQSLKSQLEWFKKQLFGQKLEKRLIDENPNQASLLDGLEVAVKPELESATEEITCKRCKGKEREKNCETEQGLRFDPDVPVERIELSAAGFNEMDPKQKLKLRREMSKPIVDSFFAWCYEQHQRTDLVNSNLLTKVLSYVRNHKEQLGVYLSDPDVSIDTNHLERALRVIPMGRKNRMFCWTEVGAQYVGIIQSLLTTCHLHGVNPYAYLVDVLQRVSSHFARDIEALTPREWKGRFADNSLRSDLELV